MKDYIYCKVTDSGTHSIFLSSADGDYFLFRQPYRKGVQSYFRRGVVLNEAMNISKVHGDHALMKTMAKLPMYIKYVEKEYGIAVMEKTKKKRSRKAA